LHHGAIDADNISDSNRSRHGDWDYFANYRHLLGEGWESLARLGCSARIGVVEGRGMDSSTAAVHARLHLVSANRAAIYGVLCRAASSGHAIVDAVVVVADTTESFGREIARAAAILPGAISDAELGQTEDLSEAAIIVVKIATAKTLLAQYHKSVADGLDRQPAANCARVVVIAQGAPMLVHTDVRPVAPITQG